MTRIRMGMAGGGEGAFIGSIHRAAARLDGEIELVCGAFSSRPETSARSAAALGLPPDRGYGSWQEMLARERSLPESQRMQFVAIVTPNHLHHPVAVAALDAGFDVLSDKPATRTLAEARDIAAAASRQARRYALTHTYLGYPMVREARERVLAGELGVIRRVVVDYPQGWLATRLESTDHRQAGWRTDPSLSGAGGCIADIGVHAFNLAEYVTGLEVTRVCGDLASVIEGRRVDDDVAGFLRFGNGARGVLTASQIASGEENEFTIRVYGERAGLMWTHRDPATLTLMPGDAKKVLLRAGNDIAALSAPARAMCRAPSGHPEGFIEAFANLYRAFAADVRDRTPGAMCSPAGPEAALRGMAFIEAMQASSRDGQTWKDLQ